jgi:vitamin B12 transporter
MHLPSRCALAHLRSLFVLVILLAPASLASAQATLTGTVVDQSGGVIAGAAITVRAADGATAGAAINAAADDSGAFSIASLPPGRYLVTVSHDLFEPAALAAEVGATGAAPLRITLRIAGLTQSTVVTGRRVETRLSETPQTIEIVDARDIERTVAADVTDLLKKNAGVDVVQYTGALSGIGIRGFRPETSGINKRSLLLIDGRPSGVTNLSTLRLDNVERIEVLKGPASAVYGASAMGGVVNVITRQSRGALAGGARVSIGSFDTTEFAASAGGNLASRLDIDVAASAVQQRDDLRMGNGQSRPATSYSMYDGSARIGADLSSAWRLDGHLDLYRGRDINTPGDVFSGVASQGRKNLERTSADARLSGQLGRHLVTAMFYGAQETNHTFNVTTSNPLDAPFLPYLTFESDLSWLGAQVRDAWTWSGAHNLVAGLDLEHVGSDSRSFARTGEAQAPFSADNHKNTTGLYAEQTFNLRGGRTVLSTGGRVDRITVETVDTPLKTNFIPSTTTFTVFNPSVGFKQELVAGLRVHATAGRAFVPADAGALTGFTTNIVGGRTQINQGNPDLAPEHSVSVDGGVEWLSPATHADVTLFHTTVDDRVVSNVILSNPPPPEPIVLTAVNTLASHINGMDVELSHRLTTRITAFSNITHYFSRTEQLPGSGERNILNVASNTVRAGIDLDAGRLSSRLALRYVQGRQDQDFNIAGSPVVDYPAFTVVDLSATYRVHPQHALVVTLNNLFDAYYFEKKGFPLAGLSFAMKYRVGR